MNTRKVDTLYCIVPGLLFLGMAVAYYLSPAGESSLTGRLVFLGAFVLLAIGAFLRRDTVPGLVILDLGLLFQAARYGKNALEYLMARQLGLGLIDLLFMAGFLFLAILCICYFTGMGAEALVGFWYGPAVLIAFGFILLQVRALLVNGGLYTSFWNFLMPILSWAGVLLLGVTASDPYFTEEEADEEDLPLVQPVVRPSAPRPIAPERHPAPQAPVRKTAAPTAPAAKEAPLSPAAAEDLKLYRELLELGVITREEFEAKKKSLSGN